jgi:hypothetical protein
MTAAGTHRDGVRTSFDALELLRQLGIRRPLLPAPRLLRALREARVSAVSSP